MSKTYNFLLRISLFIVLVILFGILSSVAGIFKPFISYFLPVFISGFIFLIIYEILILKKTIFINKLDLFVILGIFIFVLINSFFYHEIIDGARDDGVFTLNAVYLSTHGTVINNNEDLYFTGFTKLKQNLFILEFLPGYITYLAIFHSIGGLNLLFFSNSILLFFGLCWIYKVGKLLNSSKVGIITVILFITHYTTLWFSRRTNSENILLFLFWFSAFLLIEFLKTKKISNLLYGIIPLLLVFLTRPEGLMYLASYLFAVLIIFIISKFKKQALFINDNSFYSVVFLSISLLIFLISFILITKSGINYWSSGFNSFTIMLFGTASRALDVIKSKFIGVVNEKIILNNNNSSIDIINKPIIWNDFTSVSIPYVVGVLIRYFILPLLLFSFLYIKKIINLRLLVLIIFASPSFLYLINPQITPDHPWMMRRYWPIFIPLVYLLFSSSITFIKNKKIQLLLIIFVLTINILLSMPIIKFSEGRGSIAGINKLNEKLKDAQFVFFNSQASRWASSLYFIHNRKTMTGYTDKINFINPLKKYDNIYVVSSTSYNLHPLISDSSLNKIDSFFFSTPYLKRELKEIVKLDDFDFENIKSLLINLPPSKITQTTFDFNIYKLNPEDINLYLKVENDK